MNKQGRIHGQYQLRVGRGGNARFYTFRLVFTDRPTDGPTNGRTDKGSYRVACPQLKRKERKKRKKIERKKEYKRIKGLFDKWNNSGLESEH